MSTLALCIPAYNAAWCLPRLLQSASRQLILFDEVLVYDDCSTDNTAAVARELGATIVNGASNIGCSAGKNKLAVVAKSDWLFFIDSDDELYPNFTTVAHDWMKRNDAPDMVLMRYRYIDAFTGKIIDEPLYSQADLKKDTIKYTIENKIVNFELIKRDPFLRIGGFDIDPLILYIEDRAFAVKAAIAGLSFDTDTKITCIKYYFPQSMSVTNMAKWPEAGFHLWNKINNTVGKKYPGEISYQLYQNALWASKANGWDTVKKSLRLAKKITPNGQPPGSGLFQFFFKRFPFSSFYIREIISRNYYRK